MKEAKFLLSENRDKNRDMGVAKKSALECFTGLVAQQNKDREKKGVVHREKWKRRKNRGYGNICCLKMVKKTLKSV